MAFICEICNYETAFKPNYNLHLKTKRHLSKIVFPSDNPPIILRGSSDEPPTLIYIVSLPNLYFLQILHCTI